jgi:hypothetical protein
MEKLEWVVVIPVAVVKEVNLFVSLTELAAFGDN